MCCSHRCVMISLTVIVMMAGLHPTVTKEVEVEVLTAALHRSVRTHSLWLSKWTRNMFLPVALYFLLDYSLRDGLLIFFLLVVPILVVLIIVLLYVFKRDSLNRCVKGRPSKRNRSINHLSRLIYFKFLWY